MSVREALKPSSRDFLHAAAQRLTVSEFLLRHKYNLDAMYLSGYAVECSLKALLLSATPDVGIVKIHATITSGAKMHNPEVLAGYLKDLGHALPLELTKRFRRFGWSTNLRYDYGRKDTGEANGFIRTAKETYEWARGRFK